MATVRIYKVAELLNTTSQEVMALLKRDHGIEVKSASSTIEEVVAREFVSRMARQRGLSVPSNASFADTPAPPKGGKKPTGKAAEPPKPAAPSLPPPRLVKTAKPVVPAGSEPAAQPEVAEPVPMAAPAAPVEEFVAEPPPAEEPPPVVHVPPATIPAPSPVEQPSSAARA